MTKNYNNQIENSNHKLVFLEKKIITEILNKYPSNKKSSAIIPLLHYVQKQSGGWLPIPEMERVADILDMSYMRVYEIASFYTMFNLQPVGKYLLQICRTTPCWLRGSDDLEKCIKDKLKIRPGETTKDGMFTLLEVECLGACVNSPILQVNDDYYEDLNYEKTKLLLEDFKNQKPPAAGSMLGRKSSEPHVYKES